MKVFVEGFMYAIQSYGGVKRILDETLPRMCELDPGLSIDIITPKDGAHQLPAHPSIAGRAVDYTPLSGIRPRSVGRRVEPIVNQRRFDRAVHSAAGRGKSIWHTAYYRIPSRWDGPIVTTVLDMAYETFPNLHTSTTHKLFIRNKHQCIERSAMVVCISEATRQDVLKFCRVSPDKTCVIHLAPGATFQPVAEPGETLEMELPERFLFHLGNRSLNKNFTFLLEAYASWPQRHDLPLVVMGKPWVEPERSQIANLGIESDLVLISQMEDGKLAEAYRRAEAFIYPSLYEGFGMPLLEAMACGCPVVASNIPSTLEVAGEIPFYFDPASVSEFHAALDGALREGHGTARCESGVEWSKQFTWENSARQTLDVYRRVLS